MPRFFFHVHDAVCRIDGEGTDLPNVQAARAMALKFAGEILKDDGIEASVAQSWQVEVVDDRGVLLFRVDVRIIEPQQDEDSVKPI